MEELKTDTRENAETYISNNPVVLSTHAKFSFGTLRAARRYKRNPRNRNEWNSRFDDVELYVSGTEQTVDDEQTNVKIDDRWFARCAAFIKIEISKERSFSRSYSSRCFGPTLNNPKISQF